jgi:hypothetical protein
LIAGVIPLFTSNSTVDVKPSAKKVILLQPDRNMSMQEWLLFTNKDNTLPYLLSDFGYDVWIGSNRGTIDFSYH